MRNEDRGLKPYIETVPLEKLVEGETYFSVNFVDSEMIQPILLSLVFIGRNKRPGDTAEYYFQDLFSYASGVRYETASEEDAAIFHQGDIINSIQYFDEALESLIRCSVRRNEENKKMATKH